MSDCICLCGVSTDAFDLDVELIEERVTLGSPSPFVIVPLLQEGEQEPIPRIYRCGCFIISGLFFRGVFHRISPVIGFAGLALGVIGKSTLVRFHISISFTATFLIGRSGSRRIV